jgi:hypothetical protein
MMSLALILFTANAIRGGLEEYLALILFWAAISIKTGMEWDVSIIPSIRFQAGLPLSVRMLGIYRHCRVVVGWSARLILLLLSSLISMRGHIGPGYIWWLLTKLAGICILTGFSGLGWELFFCIKSKDSKLALMKYAVPPLLFLAGIYAGGGTYFFTHLSTNGNHGWFSAGFSAMLVTFPGALSALILGLVLIALDVYAFERRISYRF